ncbi:Retrovirus-related Pol polyprotein from transposon opus, partial [Mucuna pruriens]
MDKIFEKTIGVDIEVYVDDMVVKSEKANKHCETLERVFKTLRDHQLRLNPEKCSFGVQAGKFLGFMLTERGIEANPDKCQAIIDMRRPQGVKEVQQLMGKITALSRRQRLHNHFRGIEKWEVHLKERMQRGFSKTKNDDPRSAGSDTSDSSTGKRRRAMTGGPEIGYRKIEKAALALVTTSRRLRPYLENFSITVRTYFPIRQVLEKPYLAGRMLRQHQSSSHSRLPRGIDPWRRKRGRRRMVSLSRWIIQPHWKWSRNHSRRTNRNPDREIPTLRVQSEQ